MQRRSKVSLIVCLCVCVSNRIEMSGELDTYTSYPCHSRRQSFATMAAKRKKTTVFIPCHYGGEEKGDTVSSTRSAIGKCVAWSYVVEFQKRGLPHAHILLILGNADKIYSARDVDATCSAEIPGKVAAL